MLLRRIKFNNSGRVIFSNPTIETSAPVSAPVSAPILVNPGYWITRPNNTVNISTAVTYAGDIEIINNSRFLFPFTDSLLVTDLSGDPVFYNTLLPNGFITFNALGIHKQNNNNGFFSLRNGRNWVYIGMCYFKIQ